MKKLWRIWALILGEKVGNDDKEANAVAAVRTVIVLTNLICCFFIMTNIVITNL